MQSSKRSFQEDHDDSASEYEEEDKGTLVICKGKTHPDGLQLDKESLEKHLTKKLNRLEKFDSLECHDKVLSYE